MQSCGCACVHFEYAEWSRIWPADGNVDGRVLPRVDDNDDGYDDDDDGGGSDGDGLQGTLMLR